MTDDSNDSQPSNSKSNAEKGSNSSETLKKESIQAELKAAKKMNDA